MTRYDLLSKKEFEEKKAQLEEKHQEVEQQLAAAADLKAKSALCAEDIMGLEKRRAMTLAEQAFAKSKDDLKRDQEEAAKFVHKMNEMRHDLERRKKEFKENTKRKEEQDEMDKKAK